MALIYFYDASDLDREQLSAAMATTDHTYNFISDKIQLDNLDPETEVISVFVTSQVTREMIARLPRLRLIACRSTGFNNIDLVAANERDITVVNVPTYGESTVAEYAFTLATALMRKLPTLLKGESSPLEPIRLLGSDLNGKTLGVIGTGHIGQYAIRIGNGYSMNVLGYDPFPKYELQDSLHFTYKSLEDVLSEADVITIHAPYLPSTHHLINADKLGLMRRTAILVNTARGEIVDTAALVDALNNQQIAGAALDVIEGEALLNQQEEVTLLHKHDIPEELLRHSVEISLLQKMPNVIISPHNAYNTIEAVQRINGTTAENITRFWYGDIPHRVESPAKQHGKLLITRHAESEWNATGQWTGITDVHLSEKGFRESAMLGRTLKEIGVRIDVAYCSEQIRTRETLEGILDASQQFDVDIVRAQAINERDYGDYTGKNKWEVKAIIGEDAFNDLRRGWEVPVPNGETLKDVYARVVPFFEETILPQLREGKNILLVAHGNSIRALMKYLESIDDNAVAELEMLFGQILVYTLNEAGKMQDKQIHTIDSPPPVA